MQNYIDQVNSLKNPTFQQIKKLATKSISHLSKKERDALWEKLKRGKALLDTHQLMCRYLFSYGNMHEARIHFAVKELPNHLFNNDIEIIDWGCGQGLGTTCLLDFIKSQGYKSKIKKITLIEPSEKALNRAELHVNAYTRDKSRIISVQKYLDDVTTNDIESTGNHPVIHIFSNILDIPEIKLKELSQKIDKTVIEDNYIISIGPLYSGSRRIDAFYDYFNVPLIYNFQDSQFDYGGPKTCTLKTKIYKLEYKNNGNLVPIEFYPAVQFHSVYQLDCVNQALNQSNQKEVFILNEALNAFETSTPFDIGASVYDDIHPIYAVLNNLVTRGLPTKSSPYIERIFKNTFGYSTELFANGSISFPLLKNIDIEKHLRWYNSCITGNLKTKLTDRDINEFQLIFSPIAIARIQKTILEALMTHRLDVNREKWKILVEEKDVPCSAMAFEDLKNMFNKLVGLSRDYNNLIFPKIELDIISNGTFVDSELHQGANVSTKARPKNLSTVYDLVIDISIFQTPNIKKDSFSKYRCKNECYFNIRSANKIRSERNIYTTDTITYKNLVVTDARGQHTEIQKTKELLDYFLQLLFRKANFKDGQLPILNRALQNKSVIGLLPTGGGKSLTYQLAAMLQPGVTLIVDPLRALMKDQYDGLINTGIDACAYINSTQSEEEKKDAERKMEQSKLIFVFLSPERLAIYKFRQKLKNMHELNVYFSYGVIDEVHCVSEWGHDFRFSYLHLGRNLKNFVRGKDNHISLFGLTATASFDVLADVERELSGNGAFPLDSETIVRYENTNRLELQYKIEKVNVEFDDEYESEKKSEYSKPERLNKIKNKYKPLIDNGLPLPVKVSNKWAFYDAKKDFLKHYIKTIPDYINEIQSIEATAEIKKRFTERQGNNNVTQTDLKVDLPNDYYSVKDEYNQAGIVFCPHKEKTGISVKVNNSNLSTIIPKIGTFYGGDLDSENNENLSMENLELFRTNKQPLMVATKAFGMGIDKPNVRFTVNLNYSSSLEGFVQEAGRGGRDRKMALAVILLSDYKLARINKKYPNHQYPLDIIKDKWFNYEDLLKIIDHLKLKIDESYIDLLTPENDLVRLFCKDGSNSKYFDFKNCSDEKCYRFKKCKLKEVPKEAENWLYEKDLKKILKENNITIEKKHFQYQNADYETLMFFYNNSFKGERIEKQSMFQILSNMDLKVFKGDDQELKPKETSTVKGFLTTLLETKEDQEIVSFIDYKNTAIVDSISIDNTDIAKAIYRMSCIELIEDFTQDYQNDRYRIVAKRKKEGEYYKGLMRFLLRYYAPDRAEEEIKKTYEIKLNKKVNSELEKEIFQCLGFLTSFVYEKISEKRKRALDDMRHFCIEGSDDKIDWKESNEKLKDYIYFYFNSKYAKTGYLTDSGLQYSLIDDTDRGKTSNSDVLFKYMRVVEPEIVGTGTDIDNVKHLYGAVRLIRRSLTDSNPTLSLLNVFCLSFLGTKENENIEKDLSDSYIEGMEEFHKRIGNPVHFWTLFDQFNETVLKSSLNKPLIQQIKNQTLLSLHEKYLQNFTDKFLN